MAANAFLALGKMIAGVAGHSHALIADAVESLADIFSSLVVWRGLVVASTPADEDHPYGHGKAEPIAAAVVSTMLLLAAVGIGIKSVEGIITPHPGPEPFTLLVLIAVVIIKEMLFRFSSRVAESVESVAIQSDAWHHRSDALTSLAAAAGIIVALVGGRGYESADDVAALVAAGIIAWNGSRLLLPALYELMDTAPAQKVTNPIRQIAAGVAGVQLVEKCIVRKMGYHYYVDMHVEMDPALTVREAHEIAHRVKDAVRERMPKVFDVLVHIEPGRGGDEKQAAS
jgi:cation diffusion facilitator family transporter